jgi:hypothetical protein
VRRSRITTADQQGLAALQGKKTVRLLGVSVSGFVEETDAPAQIALLITYASHGACGVDNWTCSLV